MSVALDVAVALSGQAFCGSSFHLTANGSIITSFPFPCLHMCIGKHPVLLLVDAKEHVIEDFNLGTGILASFTRGP